MMQTLACRMVFNRVSVGINRVSKEARTGFCLAQFETQRLKRDVCANVEGGKQRQTQTHGLENKSQKAESGAIALWHVHACLRAPFDDDVSLSSSATL